MQPAVALGLFVEKAPVTGTQADHRRLLTRHFQSLHDRAYALRSPLPVVVGEQQAPLHRYVFSRYGLIHHARALSGAGRRQPVTSRSWLSWHPATEMRHQLVKNTRLAGVSRSGNMVLLLATEHVLFPNGLPPKGRRTRRRPTIPDTRTRTIGSWPPLSELSLFAGLHRRSRELPGLSPAVVFG